MSVHALLGVVVLAAALWLRVPLVELLLLFSAVFAVLGAEAFNTALEKTVDLVTKERHELAHIAKDVAAGAVLLSAVYAVITGLAVLGPRLWQFFLSWCNIKVF